MKYEPEIIRSKLTGEECHLYHHPSGLDVMVMRLEGFRTTEAMFATKYGSVNNRFRTVDSNEVITVPDGIAHYLEHKLFENEESGVYELYAKTGASANAFTTFGATAYTFSVSGDYKQPLRILLDFVQKPYFTQENVEKEREIITQEINMSNDSPSRAIFFAVLGAMYHNHPVRIDIAGTVDSIKDITPELLYKCYNTFYNLHNMVLSISGNIEDEEVLSICDECLTPAPDIKLETIFPDEPAGVVKKRVHLVRQVGVPIFMLGFKCDPLKGSERYRRSLAADIMLRMLFGPLSPWYKKAFESGLINSAFGTEVFSAEEGYFTILLSGESKNIDALYDSIVKEIEENKKRPMDEDLFRTLLRGSYGSEIRKFNMVSDCTDIMCSAYLQHVSPFENVDILSTLTIDEVFDTISLLDIDRSSLCTVSN